MDENNKSPQTAATECEDKKKIDGITIQISSSMISPIYENIGIAEEIIEFSKSKGWSKEQLLLGLKIIQSLEHLS